MDVENNNGACYWKNKPYPLELIWHLAWKTLISSFTFTNFIFNTNMYQHYV